MVCQQGAHSTLGRTLLTPCNLIQEMCQVQGVLTPLLHVMIACRLEPLPFLVPPDVSSSDWLLPVCPSLCNIMPNA